MIVGLATFEYLPIRVGGLAEAVTSLAEALNKEDEVMVFMPSHGLIKGKTELETEKYAEFSILVGEEIHPVQIYEAYRHGVRMFLFSNDVLDHREVYEPRENFMRKMVHFTKALPGFLNLLLKKECKKLSVIHINDWHCVFAGSLAKKYFRIPFVFTIHRICRERISYQELNEVNLGEMVENRFLEGEMFNIEVFGAHTCDYLTTVSYSYLDEEWRTFFKSFEGKTTYVWNGMDYNFWNPELLDRAHLSRRERRKAILDENGMDDGYLFFNVGRLDKDQKGIDVLLKAFEMVMENQVPGADAVRDSMRLVLLGSGDPALEKEARRLESEYPSQFKAIVKYLGREATREYYGSSDFCLIPSNFEPFGLVQLEAMCMGSLPIGTRVGGINDTVISLEDDPAGATGKLVPPRDPDALAKAMVEMALLLEEDPSQVDKMRRNGRRHVIENFNWDKAAERYRKVYQGETTLKLPFVSYAEPY